jgi:hypothetical protein
MEFRNFRKVDDAHAVDDQEPVLTLLGFLDNDAEPGDELSSRASVRGNLSMSFNTLMANDMVRSFSASLCSLMVAAPLSAQPIGKSAAIPQNDEINR